MKYGRLTFKDELVSSDILNIGDIAQVFGIDEIFRAMQIPPEEIVEIPLAQLNCYRGETVILPINMYAQYSPENPIFPTSPDIIPVFLGVYCTSRGHLRHKDYWTGAAPIGCRDEVTRRAMRKYGYEAYLMGCMTMLLPRRTKTPEKKHVFIVDVNPAISSQFPADILEGAEYISHAIPADRVKDFDNARVERLAWRVYARYRDEATLVITSRLHCAAPCIAMGIPTIVVKDNYDGRFQWMDRFVHLYTAPEIARIDWDPAPADIEDFKKLLLRAAVSMVRRAPDLEAVRAVDRFYMERERADIHSSLLVGGYIWLAQYAPRLATFLRTKILWRFTIAAGTDGRKTTDLLLLDAQESDKEE